MADGSQLRPVTFDVRTPCDRATLDARMAHRDAQSLPEAVTPKTCVIVGSGPSARHEALWIFLDANPAAKTFACNGALQVFMDRGRLPDFWTCCDPQEEVIDFLPPSPPPCVEYLLATKCPESLFEKLEHRNVWTWRLDDMNRTPGKLHVTCAVSITLVTQNLARMMGFHRFEMYGWDCCYLDGEHHASAQPKPEGEMPFEIQDEQTGDVLHRFDIVPAWAAELNDACIQAHNFKAMGYEINVHGPGAVGALLRAKKLIA